MGAGRDHLRAELHYARDLADSDVLLHLQSVLGAAAPDSTSVLAVHAGDSDREPLHADLQRPDALRDAVLRKGVQRGPLFEALSRESPPPGHERRFGSVVLKGRTRGLSLGVRFDSTAPATPIGASWLWSNSITVTVSAAGVAGQDRAAWVRRVLSDLSRHPDLLWGAAFLHRHFDATNLDTTSGVVAVGRDVRRHLPGLYWLNAFGAPYRDLIGAEPLRRASPDVVAESEHAVVLQAYASPEDWATHGEEAARLRTLLGDDLFFDRQRPERPTRAPDLGLAPLSDRPPLQVVTADGRHVTPLPR